MENKSVTCNCSNPMFHKKVECFDLDNIPIIGNFNNQTIIGLDNEGVEFISQLKSGIINLENLNKNQQELFDALKENGYFDHNIPMYPTCAYIHITDNCNLHCVGCYSFVSCRNEKKDLTTDQWKLILNKLKDMGINLIVVSGGEPFLREDLSEILRYIKEDLQISDLSIISNGTMAQEKYEKCLPYLKSISISIDGYSTDTRFIRDPGIMPKVFETIKYLKDHQNKNGSPEVCMIGTLSKKTIPYMENYAQLSKDLDIPFSFSVLTVDHNNPEFKDYILDEDAYDKMHTFIKDNKEIVVNDSLVGNVGITARKCCGIGKGIISIGADGSIYPCQMLHIKELILGNILVDDLKEVLDSDKNPCHDLTVDNFEKCKECKYKYICGGGCRASSYYQYGDLLHPEAPCKQTEDYFKFIIDSMKKHFNIA